MYWDVSYGDKTYGDVRYGEMLSLYPVFVLVMMGFTKPW
jgi:hypothetical protein